MNLARALPAVLCLAAACADDAGWRARLVPIPEPDLARHEQKTQAKIQDARKRAEAAIASRDATASSAAEASGELGRIYFAHDLWRSAEASLANAATLAPDDRRWPYLLGVLAQLEGRADDAAARLQRALALAPGDGPTLIRLGQVEFDLGHGESSRQRYEQAAVIPAMAPAAHFGLGRGAAAAGDAAGAVDHFEKALAAQPEASVVHNALGLALRSRGRRDDAQRHLAQAGTAAVSFADPLVDALSDLVTSAHSYVRRGDLARVAGNPDQALREYRLAVEADPAVAMAQYQQGSLLGERGDTAESIVHLRRATELDPQLEDAFSNLATALLRAGQADAAVRALDRVLELDPAHSSARLRRAAVRRDRGQADLARADLEEILAREPMNADAIADLALVLARSGRAAEADRLLRKTLARRPPPLLAAKAHAALAFLAGERGDLARAVAEYRLAAAATPDDGDIRFGLGRTLVLAGRLPEAAEAFAEAARLQPDNTRAHLGLAHARIAAGQWLAARIALETALSRMPRDLTLTATLAEVLAGSPDASVRDGERALQLATTAYRADRGADHAEAVGMALAELGRFDEAVRFQRELLADARKAEAPPPVQARLAANLARYERNEPVRIGR